MIFDWLRTFSKKKEAAMQERAERSRELKKSQEQGEEVSDEAKNIIYLSERIKHRSPRKK